MMLRSESAAGSFDLERAKRLMLRIIMATMAAPAEAPIPPVPLREAAAAANPRAPRASVR